MLKERTKASDCRIKGFLVEIEEVNKDDLTIFENSGLKFDMVFCVKKGLNQDWDLVKKSCWQNSRNITVEISEDDTTEKIVERLSSHLQYVQQS